MPIWLNARGLRGTAVSRKSHCKRWKAVPARIASLRAGSGPGLATDAVSIWWKLDASAVWRLMLSRRSAPGPGKLTSCLCWACLLGRKTSLASTKAKVKLEVLKNILRVLKTRPQDPGFSDSPPFTDARGTDVVHSAWRSWLLLAFQISPIHIWDVRIVSLISLVFHKNMMLCYVPQYTRVIWLNNTECWQYLTALWKYIGKDCWLCDYYF